MQTTYNALSLAGDIDTTYVIKHCNELIESYAYNRQADESIIKVLLIVLFDSGFREFDEVISKLDEFPKLRLEQIITEQAI